MKVTCLIITYDPSLLAAKLLQVQAVNKELLAHITRMKREKIELGRALDRTKAKLSESNQSNEELTASNKKLLLLVEVAQLKIEREDKDVEIFLLENPR